jgi:hypothetical protein
MAMRSALNTIRLDTFVSYETNIHIEDIFALVLCWGAHAARVHRSAARRTASQLI